MQEAEIIVTRESKEALGAAALRDVRVLQQPSDRKVHRLFVLDVQTVASTIEGLSATLRRSSENTFVVWSRNADSMLFSVLSSARRRLEWEPFVAQSPEELRRVVRANARGAADKLIAKADVVDGKLLVWSCEPRFYECAASAIPALSHRTAEELKNFELSSSGSRIYWPDIDVDIDMETIRYWSDDRFRQAVDRQTRKRTQKYGKAIRSLRVERGISQSSVAGLTDRQIRRLEAGEVQPHFSTLEKLTAAHAMPLDAYLGELASRS